MAGKKQIHSTIVDVKCPHCGKVIRIRIEADDPHQSIQCWNCGTDISVTVYGGYGKVGVIADGQRLQWRFGILAIVGGYKIIWQEGRAFS